MARECKPKSARVKALCHKPWASFGCRAEPLGVEQSAGFVGFVRRVPLKLAEHAEDRVAACECSDPRGRFAVGTNQGMQVFDRRKNLGEAEAPEPVLDRFGYLTAAAGLFDFPSSPSFRSTAGSSVREIASVCSARSARSSGGGSLMAAPPGLVAVLVKSRSKSTMRPDSSGWEMITRIKPLGAEIVWISSPELAFGAALKRSPSISSRVSRPSSSRAAIKSALANQLALESSRPCGQDRWAFLMLEGIASATTDRASWAFPWW